MAQLARVTRFAQAVQDRDRSVHGDVARRLTERLLIPRHHVAVHGARKDLQRDVRHLGRQCPIGGDHLRGRGVILVAPQDAEGRGHALEVADEIDEAGAVAGDAGGVAEPLRPHDGVGAAIAEAHGGGAAVELRQRAQISERIGHVGFARPDLLQPRLRAFGRARIVARQRPRQGAPEQVGRRRDIALGSERIGDVADILVDAVHRAREHDRRHLALACGKREVAIEGAAIA